MKAAVRLALVAVAAAFAVGTGSAASTPPRIVEAGGSAYPDRSYILTLPAARSLKRSQVTVTENGSRVPVTSIVRQGTGQSKSAVVLALDESLTMKGKPIASALAAARAFAARANPDEEIAVVTFNGSVDVLHGFTTSASSLDGSLAKTPKLSYGTKNYDALERALGLITSANVASGSIIILTDGQNVGSVAKAGPVLHDLSKAHVRVFSIGLSSPAFKAAPLQQMASATGGSYVQANGPSALRPILLDLGQQLSSEYLLTYRSRSNPDTQVSVGVAVKGLPGVASSAYTTPALHVVAAKPYKPSRVDRAIQSTYLLVAVVLVFALLLAFAVVHVGRGRPDPLVERVSGFVTVQQSAAPTLAEARPARKPLFRRPAVFSRIGVQATSRDWYQRLALALDIADLEIGPYQLLFLAGLLTILVGLVFVVAIGPIGILFAVVVPVVVRSFVLRRVARKRRAFAEQLPDCLDVLASSLRAGHSLVSALSVVAEDAVEPSKSEFQRVLAEEQFGAPLEDALQIAVTRMDNQDLDQVALVARLQREMGSNSAEVLDHVIATVRGRMELRRMIRTLTAQGRLSRGVLTALPIGLALILTLMASSYMHPLLYRPIGRVLLVGAAGMVALGSWAIGKIVDIRIA